MWTMQLVAHFPLAGAISRGDAAAFETGLVAAIIVLLVLLFGVRALRSHDLKMRRSRYYGRHRPRLDGPSQAAEQEASANRALTPSFVSSRRRRGWRGGGSDRVTPAPVASTLWVAHGFAVDRVPVPNGAGTSAPSAAESETPAAPRHRAPHRSPALQPAPLASTLPRLELPPPPRGPSTAGQLNSRGPPG